MGGGGCAFIFLLPFLLYRPLTSTARSSRSRWRSKCRRSKTTNPQCWPNCPPHPLREEGTSRSTTEELHCLPGMGGVERGHRLACMWSKGVISTIIIRHHHPPMDDDDGDDDPSRLTHNNNSNSDSHLNHNHQ